MSKKPRFIDIYKVNGGRWRLSALFRYKTDGKSHFVSGKIRPEYEQASYILWELSQSEKLDGWIFYVRNLNQEGSVMSCHSSPAEKTQEESLKSLIRLILGSSELSSHFPLISPGELEISLRRHLKPLPT